MTNRYVAQRQSTGWCVLNATTGAVVSQHGAGRSGADEAAAAVLRLESQAERTPDHALRAWRAEHGLSQAQLAMRLGVSVLAIKRWEGGSRTPPAYLQLALQQLESQTERTA